MQATYHFDPAHSRAHFTVRHMMISNVRGQFSGVSGTIRYDPENPAATTIEASIDTSTISTREDARDAHLKSADFLEVEKYPAITFKSKRVEPSEDEWKIIGDLTIHGVTREVVLKAEPPTKEEKDPWGNFRMGVSAATKIRRSDFGLTWNAALETGGILVGDEVKIELDVEVVKAAEAVSV